MAFRCSDSKLVSDVLKRARRIGLLFLEIIYEVCFASHMATEVYRCMDSKQSKVLLSSS